MSPDKIRLFALFFAIGGGIYGAIYGTYQRGRRKEFEQWQNAILRGDLVVTRPLLEWYKP